MCCRGSGHSASGSSGEGAAVRFLKVSLPGNPQCRLCPVVRFRSHYKIRVRVCEKTAVLHSLHRVHFLCLLPAFLRGCPHLLFGPGEMLCPGVRCHVRFSGRWCRDGRHATTGTWVRSCRCGGSRPGAFAAVGGYRHGELYVFGIGGRNVCAGCFDGSRKFF